MTAAAPPDDKPGDWRFIAYNVLLLAVSPLILLYVLWCMLGRGVLREGLAERLGFVSPEAAELAAHDDPVVWLHACSVGEVAAAAPIINAVRRAEPLVHIVLSTTTATGREMARGRNLEVDALVYFPLDLPFAVGRALEAVKPDALVMVDTELWPNIMSVARSMGIRTAVVNGRISDRAFPRDRAVKPVIAWTLGNVELILAQSERDAERFIALGAAPEKVRVVGNAKFDEEPAAVSAAEADKLRQDLGLPSDAPVLVAGSTREGEEEQVLEAFDALRHEIHSAQLVIAPRHPERGDAVERLVVERGWAAFRRSRALADEADLPKQPAAESQVRVVILDTIGELNRVYALATVVFVGGSLVPCGGHNILQPIALGKPTLMGPHMQNQRDIADIAVQEQAASTINSPEELAEAAARIINSNAEQELLAARCRAMLDRHSGAARRHAQHIVDLLRGDEPPADVPV